MKASHAMRPQAAKCADLKAAMSGSTSPYLFCVSVEGDTSRLCAFIWMSPKARLNPLSRMRSRPWPILC